MGKKIIIILTSLLTAFVIMSSGYGKWQKKLIIEGNILIIPNTEGFRKLVEDEVNLQKESLGEEAGTLEKRLPVVQSEGSFKGIDKTIKDNNASISESTSEGTTEETNNVDQTGKMINEEDEANVLLEDITDSQKDNTNSQEDNTKEPESILNTDMDNSTTQPEIDSSDD